MRFLLVLFSLALTSCAGTSKPPTETQPPPMPPPVAAIHPHSVTLHGDTRVDDYFWLRDKGSPQVTAYLQAENAYAEERLAPTAALQKTLYDEIVGRIQETDQSAPYRKGTFEYYHRTEEGKQYRTYCRREPASLTPSWFCST